MKKLLFFTVLSLALGAGVANAQAITAATADSLMGDHRVIELSEKYFSMLDSIYPEESTRAGSIGYQYSLEPRDRQSETIKKETVKALRAALDSINFKKLSASKEGDYLILSGLVNKKIFEAEVSNRLENDPTWYLEALSSVYDILIKDYKNPQERLSDAMRRLQSFPNVLAQGEENLQNPPDLAVRIAMEKANAAYSSINALSTLLGRIAPDDYTREQITIITNDTKKAVKDYFDFLKEMMDTKTYVDFRLGEKNFNELLKSVYLVNIQPKKYIKTLEKEVETSKTALIAALTPVIEPSFTDAEREKRTNEKGVIQISPADYYIATKAFTKHPQYNDVLKEYLNAFNNSVAFFKDKKIFPPSSLKVVILPAPKFLQQKYTGAVYLPPFPLIPRQSGDLLVAIPESEKGSNDTLEELFTYGKIRLNVMENITVGRNLLYSASEGYVDRIRKISDDMFYINGWIKYALNLSKEKGYLVQDDDLVNLAWYNYKTAVLAMTEFKMQNGETNYTQSLETLIKAGIDKDEAAAALDYVSMHPASALASIYGEQEFTRLRTKYQRKLGSKFVLEDFHDKVISVGRVPVPHLEKAVDKAYEAKPQESFFKTIYF